MDTKVSKKNSPKSDEESCIQPNVECSAVFGRLLNPRFHQRGFGESCILGPTKYSIFSYMSETSGTQNENLGAFEIHTKVYHNRCPSDKTLKH